MKQFAEDYSRTKEGWIIFPPDTEYRKQIFPEEVNKHTAKANVYLIQSIIEYVSEPDQTLLDIMAGTGTLMVGTLIGRRIICIEISPMFTKLMNLALAKLETIAPGAKAQVSIINTPCQNILPIPLMADHIIFSPPYAGIMKSKGTDRLTTEKTDYDMAEYSQHPLNFGLMNDFIWAQEMEQVYKKCYDTLPAGGTLTIIVKDHMEKRKRIPLTQAAMDACLRVGFVLKDWFKWYVLGSVYTRIYRARGWETVDDEDIIILSKPDHVILDEFANYPEQIPELVPA